ncbi:hypothetical protein PIB30_060621 [Stylosanthes scabra]|uniref:Uncharacterized protein n=1 Tax=Stylosanthes scabra TaxID=79078 RepID=A0ABU6WK92_9FABA|nr:hypothetical protein [Stylosanthes scabra]
MSLDPNFTTATATTGAPARPISPLRPNPQLTKPNNNHTNFNDQSQNHNQNQNQPFLYPVSSSGRGFIPGITNSFARGGGGGSTETRHVSPSLAYARGVHAHLEYLSHITRHHQLGSNVRALPLSPQQHKGTPPSAVTDTNGYKDTSTRERSRDDQYIVVRDRKVRITEDASLYALCRSWLRNGVHEENQPRQNDVMRALPKPLPASAVAGMSNKKEEKDNDEDKEKEESVEHLSAPDILKRHIRSAKKVRARLREERLQRISRYRSRLQLLIPSPVEHFKNDTAAGN